MLSIAPTNTWGLPSIRGKFRTISSTRPDRGTRCSSWVSFVPARDLGTVQIPRIRSISSQVAPVTAEVLDAVRIVNSSALAEMLSKARSSAMKAGTSPYGMAGWWRITLILVFCGKCSERWPFHRAGFRPLRRPANSAQSKTFSIRPRTLLAVSGFSCQIGSRIFSM